MSAISNNGAPKGDSSSPAVTDLLRPSGASDCCQGWERARQGERTPLESSGSSPPLQRGGRSADNAVAPAFTESPLSLDTLALHGSPTDDFALITPLVQSTTFHTGGPHAYSRVSNPTVDALERELGALESAPPAVTFSTGLAAETALFLTLLKQGDHAVIGRGVYGGTVRLFRQILSELGIAADFVDTTDPSHIARALTPRTKLVFIESPTNPTLELDDIAAIRDTAFLDKLRFIRKATGAIQTPFNAWLTSRGLKTLPLRIRQHSENALTIARRLAQNPAISRVNYPGLDNFPQRELAQRQHTDLEGRALHGGVISFELEGGIETGREFLKSLSLCALVEHVGSVETLITHPATMTHADVPRDQRIAAGITDGLIRLSVGLENPRDILADLNQAIAAATQPVPTSLPHATSQTPKASSSIAGGCRVAAPPESDTASPTPKGSSCDLDSLAASSDATDTEVARV
jgi:cystathionine beta-lyase/cystathionine gamma-synthase